MALFNRSSLFVHINKAGGGTVVEAMGATAKELHLRFELSGRHRTLGGFESEATKLGVDVARLRVFTIVRNPWDRMVSMYHFYGMRGKENQGFDIRDARTGRTRSFDEWIRHIYSPAWPASKIHHMINMLKHCFGNQLDWLGNRPERVRVLRFERYQEEVVPYLRDEVGLKISEEAAQGNSSASHSSEHRHFCTYYTDVTRPPLVAKHYQRDILSLNYSFPEDCAAAAASLRD